MGNMISAIDLSWQVTPSLYRIYWKKLLIKYIYNALLPENFIYYLKGNEFIYNVWNKNNTEKLNELKEISTCNLNFENKEDLKDFDKEN